MRKIVTLLLFLASSLVWAGAPVWIDVRTPEEYAQDHLQGVDTLIPYEQIGNKIAELNLSKDTEINVYCRSGKRAGVAKQTLESLGYTKVYNRGGLNDARAYVASHPGSCQQCAQVTH